VERHSAQAAIGSVSFALLVHEILLSAIFHVLIGGGNTVAAIAVALLGLSASGIVAYLHPTLRCPERAEPWMGRLLLGFGLVLYGCVFGIMAIPLQHGDLVFAPPGEWRVPALQALVYALAALPFFVGGLVVTLVLRSRPEQVSRLYFTDLAGAAFGCVAAPLLLAWLGAPRGILCAGLPALALAFAVSPAWRPPRRALAALPVGLLALAVADPGSLRFRKLNTMGDVRAPAHQGFRIADGDLEFERWALDAWTVIRSPGIPQQWQDFRGWGLSPRYAGPVPRIRLVNYNARFSTYVTEFDGRFEPIAEWLDADLISLHHALGRSFRRVLNVGAGGGREVLSALQHGAESVLAIDVSRVVVEEIMKGFLRDWSGGLYLDPRVEAVADEGRSAVERLDRRFDLIEFSIVGGMNLEKMDLVRVEDLFTVEALRSYFERLEPEGVFSYVMYSLRADRVDELAARSFVAEPPYVPALHTLAGLRGVLAERLPGADPADHFLVAALRGVIDPSFDLVHILASRSPFTAEERARFVVRSQDLGFLVLHPVGAEPAALYAELIATPDPEALARRLPFRVAPASDDRPFHYAFDLRDLRRAAAHGALGRFLGGNPVVELALPIAALALLVIAAPLLWQALREAQLPGLGGGGGWLLLYFAGIGYGYMAVEIAALLRLQLYLGQPLYSLSVALFSFLLASGFGSRFTARFGGAEAHRAALLAVLAVLAAGLAYRLAAPSLVAATLHLPLAARAMLAVAALFPLAFALGTLFPLGVKLVTGHGEDLIPWAWAMNGCASVLGIFGTRLVSLATGFDGALLLGLGAYAGVGACVLLHAARRRAA
jgi:SAM-dependent methyltransferase